MKKLFLKKGEEKRLKLGHLWVFSNEIDTSKSPLKNLNKGEQVYLVDNCDNILAIAYANPSSLITARVLSLNIHKYTNLSDLLKEKLEIAYTLRQNLFSEPYYRLINAEGDFLPGLVIDRYQNTFVVQINTAGMEVAKAEIISALQQLFQPELIILRCDSNMRKLEEIPLYIETVTRTNPTDSGIFEVKENGLTFKVPCLWGQKTGWFYDQRPNRALFAAILKNYSVTNKNIKVLDAFSYLGGFGVGAAKAGATQVDFLDSSATALELAKINAQLNAPECNINLICGDALSLLSDLKNQKKIYDFISIDPPAFIKRKKDEQAGLAAYQKINEAAISLVCQGGIVVSSSCSQHLDREIFRKIINKAALKCKRRVQIIAEGHQGLDHPINPAMPETAYLKAYFLRID